MAPSFPGSTRVVRALALAAALWLSISRPARAADLPSPASADVVAISSIAALRAKEAWDPHHQNKVSFEGTVTLVAPAERRLVLQDAESTVSITCDSAITDLRLADKIRIEADAVYPEIPSVPGFPFEPRRSEILDAMHLGHTNESNYVDRFQAYVVPPATGTYRFWVTSDDSSELWLSDDASPDHAHIIATVPGYTSDEEWTRFRSQQSGPIELRAGVPYYIEILHEQTDGEDHSGVAWSGPSMPREFIRNEFLRPFPSHRAEETSLPGRRPVPAQRGALREVWPKSMVLLPDDLRPTGTSPSRFSVAGSRIVRIAAATLPSPAKIRVGQALPAAADFRWSEVTAEIRSVRRSADGIELELADGDAKMLARMPSLSGPDPSEYRGYFVRLDGVCELAANATGERIPSILWLPPLERLAVVGTAPAWEQQSAVPIRELGHLAYTADRELPVRIRGRVLSATSQKRFVLQDEGSFSAYMSYDGTKWTQVGDEVDVPMHDPVSVGLAATSNGPQETIAAFEHVAGLDPHARGLQIGDQRTSGDFNFDGKTYTVRGVGEDIWDYQDEFYFVHGTATGETELTAKISALEIHTNWAKAGLMIRESLAADAPFVDVVTMGGSLVSLQWRWNNPHPTTEGVNLPIERSDIWLKLARHHHAVPVDALEDTPLSPGDLIDVFGYVQRSETGPTISHGFVRSAESEGSRALPDNDRPLIDVQALHVLSKSALPNYFRIRGVVTCSRSLGGHHYLAIQDHTGGIFVLLPNIRARDLLTPGTLVDAYLDPIVAGRTNDLLVAKIIPRGPAAMPSPVPHPVEMVGPDRGAGQWIGVEGIVYATTNQNQGILRSAGSYLTVDAAGMTREDWSNLIDRRVRVQGVAAYPNPPRMTVLVPGPGYVEPTTFDVGAASSPSRRISEVSATKEIEDPSHRVRVVGTVTFVHERLAVIDDGSAAVSAQISEGSAFAKPGERVEAAGFPVSDGNGSTKLLFATLRADGRGAIPAPIRAAPSAVLDGAYGPRLVTFDAEIVGSAVAGTGTAFDLQSDGRKFRAWCPATIRSAASLPSGSQVRLVGFAYPGLPDAVADEVPFGGREQSVFVIRSASDLTYLHGPPWMALRRALFVIGTLAGVLVIAVFWVQILRRRVRQQKDQLNATLADLRRETELAATLTERQRLAGEIHDSLEQGISGIMLQLEGALKSPSCSSEVREILKGARNMVSFSHAEIRHAIWDLHSPTLDGGNLSSALQQIAARLGVDRPRVEVAVTGAPLTISPETDHHLLRIAQEAVTNSLKHADASKIVISLEYTPEAITLRIEDDGRGFDADGLLVDDGHFGLRSLQRRADKMNAELTVKSVPGDGTCVEVIIPSRNHAMI